MTNMPEKWGGKWTEHPEVYLAITDELLDALEDCVQQFMRYERGPDGEGYYSHDFMSTGEHLSALMPRYRPERWKDNGVGLVPLFEVLGR